MTKYRVLINAANLHVGGGVQVATSFLSELDQLEFAASIELVLYVSTQVHHNLQNAGFKNNRRFEYRVMDVFGLQALSPRIASHYYRFDLVFSIFGPVYLPRRIPNHVVGFAQAWILFPENDASARMGLRQRLTAKLKFRLQWLFFLRATRLVVELPHSKQALVEKKGFPEENIDVVPNCVSSVFYKADKWTSLVLPERRDQGEIWLGYVARDYVHKNVDFLLSIARELRTMSAVKYRFFVTLNEDEYLAKSAEFRNEVSSVGAISVTQCPTFYHAMDGVIFPSLLESFSATPLEALVMRRPLFASDRAFVRDVCGEHAVYFDPLDAKSAAESIDQWFTECDADDRDRRLEAAYLQVGKLPGSKSRAFQYANIIQRQLGLTITTDSEGGSVQGT